MLNRTILVLAAFVTMLTFGEVARADEITLTGINGTGVTATISNFSLVGNQFTFTINNTSVAPGTTGTITNIGFALPGNRPNTYQLVSATNSNYTIVHDVNATSGAQNFVSTFDLVLHNGNSGTFGGGSTNNGIAPGASATFTISGDFSGLTAEQTANAIFARFQGVGPNGNLSDVAASHAPEPVTLVLLGTGLAGVAAAARRRRRTVR